MRWSRRWPGWTPAPTTTWSSRLTLTSWPLRRSAGRAAPGLQLGGVVLDLARRSVQRDGVPVTLSAREYAIVEALALRPGAILSRAQLEERMYGWGEEIESNAVEVHIHAIRRKLGAEFIRNVRGVGYYIPRPDGAT